MTAKKTNRRRVCCLGMGAMGSTLARTLLKSGYEVTVWNRTAARCASLVEDGAVAAATAEAAVQDNGLVIICFIDKAAVEVLLKDVVGKTALTGKTIVNVSSGLESEAEAIAQLVYEAGGSYLDGGILAYPRDIGKATTCILYSGDENAYKLHEEDLAVLAGSPMYLGSDVKKCTRIYLPFYVFYFGCLASWMEGASLASASNVSLDEFQEILPVMLEMLTGGIADATDRINRSDFRGDQASVDVHLEGQEFIRGTCISVSTPHKVIDAFIDYCKLARDKGMGSSDIAALFTAMNNGTSP